MLAELGTEAAPTPTSLVPYTAKQHVLLQLGSQRDSIHGSMTVKIVKWTHYLRLDSV